MLGSHLISDIFKDLQSWRSRNSPIVIFHKFYRPPYGGGNQFLLGLKHQLEKMGHQVGTGYVGPNTKTVLFNSFNFDFERLKKVDRSKVRMIHRVDGPIGAYRGTEAVEDREIWQINHDCADATIFQSRYSYEKHLEMGMKFINPTIICNAANNDIFYPEKGHRNLKDRRVKVIATSWSKNAKKGVKTYQWLDANLDRSKFEFTFVGQIDADLPRSKKIPPVNSETLAGLLRQHDIYITASENDPCSNALIEALSCNLPAIFLKSGGHPEIVGEGGLGFESPEEIPVLLENLRLNYETFVNAIRAPQISDVARKYLQVFSGTTD